MDFIGRVALDQRFGDVVLTVIEAGRLTEDLWRGQTNARIIFLLKPEPIPKQVRDAIRSEPRVIVEVESRFEKALRTFLKRDDAPAMLRSLLESVKQTTDEGGPLDYRFVHAFFWEKDGFRREFHQAPRHLWFYSYKFLAVTLSRDITLFRELFRRREQEEIGAKEVQKLCLDRLVDLEPGATSPDNRRRLFEGAVADIEEMPENFEVIHNSVFGPALLEPEHCEYCAIAAGYFLEWATQFQHKGQPLNFAKMIGTKALCESLGIQAPGNFEGLVRLTPDDGRLRITALSDERWSDILNWFPDIWLHCQTRIPQKLYIHLIDLVIAADRQPAFLELIDQNNTTAIDTFNNRWGDGLTAEQQSIREEQLQAIRGTKYRTYCYAARILHDEILLERAWVEAEHYYLGAPSETLRSRIQNCPLDTFLTGKVLFGWRSPEHQPKFNRVIGILEERWNGRNSLLPNDKTFDLHQLAAGGVADELCTPPEGRYFVPILDRIVPNSEEFIHYFTQNERAYSAQLASGCLILLAAARRQIDVGWDEVALRGFEYWTRITERDRILHFMVPKFMASYCVYQIYRNRFDLAHTAASVALERCTTYAHAFPEDDCRAQDFFTEIINKSFVDPSGDETIWRAICHRALQVAYAFPY